MSRRALAFWKELLGECVARNYIGLFTDIEELQECFKKNITHTPEYVCTGYIYYTRVERDVRCRPVLS
jgi:hypothetical protein